MTPARLGGSILTRGAYILLIAAATPVLLWNGFVQHLNAGLEDILMRLRPAVSSRAVDRIVLVAIDDRTASSYGPLPLGRAVLARGLSTLSDFRPDVLAIDLLFAQSSDAEQDAELVEAVRAFRRPVLATALVSDPGGIASWLTPFPALAESGSLAHVHADPDADGILRSILLAKSTGPVRRWALGMEAAGLALTDEHPLEAAEFVQVGPTRVPAPSGNRQMAVNFAGPEGTFRRVSFASLLEGECSDSDFAGKIVIVGVTAQGSGDRLFTPMSSGIGMTGVEIHANVVRTILDEAFLVPADAPTQLLAGLLVAAACVLAAIRFRAWMLFATLALLAAALPAVCLISLQRGFILPLGSLLAVFLASAGVAATTEYALVARALRSSERQRRMYASRAQAIAHEIKTPLTAIQGSSELIAEPGIPQEQKGELAHLIFTESKRLNGIIRAFLEADPLAAGDLALTKRTVALAALCGEVLERACLYAARKSTRIEARISDVSVEADAELLSFAVYNLLTNAVKYSPGGSVVKLNVAADGAAAAISVSDQGSGIAPEEREKIFGRFYRSARDRHGREEGTGIGLALARDIVERHGGRILVESEPGCGSRFTITIPRSRS